MHRKDDEWHDHGSQGEALADGPGSRNISQHDLCGVPGEIGEDGSPGSTWPGSSPISHEDSSSSPKDVIDRSTRSNGNLDSRECRTSGTASTSRGDNEADGVSAKDESKCSGEGGAQVLGISKPLVSSSGQFSKCCRHGGDSGGLIGGGDRPSGPPGLMSAMWTSLARLRCQMRPSCHTSTTASTGLELGSGSHGDGIVNEAEEVPVNEHGCCNVPPLVPTFEDGIGKVDFEDRQRTNKDILSKEPAWKMSKTLAALGAMIVLPVQGLLTQVAGATDFMEIACSPNSSLCSKMNSMGYEIKRINYKEGYDLDSRRGARMLDLEIKTNPPKFTWVSLPCTRISPLQNLTARSPEEWAKFEQRQGRDMKRAEEVAESIGDNLISNSDADMAWEWPTNAHKGWRSRAIQKLLRKITKAGKTAYWCRFHGCAYGLMHHDLPVQKSWTVLTTNRKLWMSLQRKCPGHPEHLHCRGEVAMASSYYPKQMVDAVCKSVAASWVELEEAQKISLTQDIEHYLLDLPCRDDEVSMVRKESPEIFALSRNVYPKEAPTGKKLESIRQQMMRIHRAAGHPSFSNLQRLLRARRAPEWAVALAGGLQCPECIESRRPQLHPPASLNVATELYEVIGVDVFEYEREEDVSREAKEKHKLLLWRDRASGYVYVEHLQTYTSAWEPRTSDILRSLSRWLMLHPSPKWILTDAGTVFTSEEFLEFAGRSGIGVMTAPAEAHWILGAEEGCINVLKNAVKRILKEEPLLPVPEAFAFAAHGHNHTIGHNGFSPFQWVRGGACPQEDVVAGIDPKKAFAGQLKMKEKARIAYEQENAKYKLSKLNNAVGRRPMSYKPGSLVMVWRQKMKPGKVQGHWNGPVRVLLQEGSTLWLASGAALIKAKTNQVRECSKREDLQATLNGVTIYKHPTTVENLLRNFTGKHYQNITGENPSKRQMESDMTGAEVLRESRQKRRIELPRGSKRKEPPAADDGDVEDNAESLPGVHQERPQVPPGDPPDNFQGEPTGGKAEELSGDPLDNFRGEPRGDGKETKEPSGDPLDSFRGEPRGDGNDPEARHHSAENNLDQALKTKGPNAVDGLPDLDDPGPTGNQCYVPGCALPGGHAGPHKDEENKTFQWTPYSGRIPLEENSDDDDSVSSTSSEELVPELQADPSGPRIDAHHVDEQECLYALEIEIEQCDIDYLMKHPHKSTIWMSKRMMEKSKEESWAKLPLSKKHEFDLAQAKELANVLQSKALRSLTAQEWKTLPQKRPMQMRWVLTTKSDSSAKARLVVLGYQAHNLCEVQASAPTLGRSSKMMLLALCANFGLKVRAGDVTSAFLQASQSLEDEDLLVWAPAELAVLYGASPKRPVMPLKVCRAFYGLVHSPRKWYEHMSGTLKRIGWRALLSDPCVFVLEDPTGKVVGLSGLHVDDILIGGDEDSEVFQTAQRQLEESYRWGKWDQGSFTFAGTRISQEENGTIKMDQREYSEKWLSEVKLENGRDQYPKLKATPEEISQLRGAIGSIAWRSSQTSPQFQADANLLLSEVPFATVETLLKANKLVREVKRTSEQCLLFPCWKVPWDQLVISVWADASNGNRPDRSSTMGVIAGMCTKKLLEHQECQIAVIYWKSSKCPRQVLGSNGAEVQAITDGEDVCFRLRALLAEFQGISLDRSNIHNMVRDHTTGILIMDSRGIYDAMSRNISSLHGLRSGRSGYELAISVRQAKSIGTIFRWVNGDAQLGDVLTKWNSRKVFLQFLAANQHWKLVYDENFIAARKLKKRDLEKKLHEAEENFISWIGQLARQNRWPWDEPEDQMLRSLGDEIIRLSCEHSTCQVSI